MGKVRWGVLGAAKIATAKVIPAMQRCANARVMALASRDLAKAEAAAAPLGIDRAYGSYEELLADPDVDAIYNPLPNHLHVSWSVKAAVAGKHVLCEKPISMNAAECRELIAARDKYGVQIGEAFMVRSHPQWLRVRELVQGGSLGELRSVITAFSYNNTDPKNIRNVPEYGGGALMDIGCYAIQISRWMFGSEPIDVQSAIEWNPEMKTDRLTSALVTFAGGHAVFTCSTQLAPYQRVQLLFIGGRIEVEIPFNAPPDQVSKIQVTTPAGTHVEEFPACDQYTLQGDDFSRAILNGTAPPVPLEDALKNMETVDRVFKRQPALLLLRAQERRQDQHDA